MKPRNFLKRVALNWRGAEAHRIAWVLAATGALCAGASAFHLPVVEAQSGHIDTISPPCAHVGGQVTITGQGFGAHNVTIAVDGVPALVVSANG